MANLFSGTGVALVTPFKNQEVDFAALEKLVNYVIEGGVNYIVALGTTAETPTLTTEEKKKVLSFIIEKCNGRVPVVCGIGGNNTAEVIHQIKEEYDLSKVAGILSVAPYYNKPTQEGVYQHFKAIASATDKPIILYNVPGRTVINILPATALRLANEFKHIVAIKEASGNFVQCMELVQNKPTHFAVLSGDDDLILPQMAIGMEGVISVAANCFTKDFTGMVNNALKGDFDEARKLHYKMLEGIHLLFTEGNPAGVKCVLNNMGLCENELRLPLVKVSDATAQKIRDFMGKAGY